MNKKLNNISVALSLTLLAIVIAGTSMVLAAGPTTVNLMSASNFAVLSKTGVTNTGSHSTVVNGDVGSSPITAVAMNNVFCSEVTGTIYGVDATYVGSGSQACFAGNPPLSNKALVDNAVLDMEAAYNDAAGRALPLATDLNSGNLGGLTLLPGLYKWNSDVVIPTNLTLSGGANDVWIMQVAGNLDIASGGSIAAGTKILLTGGAQASNVFWQVGGPAGATLGTYSTFNGTILSAKQVILQTGAILNGRALAQTQVVLDANKINLPTVSTLATLHVVKLVVGSSTTATSANFMIHVSNTEADVPGSPAVGSAGLGTAYTLGAGTYSVSETATNTYTQSFAGDCNSAGSISLLVGDDKTCILTNTEKASVVVPVVPVVVAPVISGSIIAPVTPAIGVTKVANPSSLPTGPGQVTFNYTVWNVGGQRALTDIKVIDDKCSDVTYVSGDVNFNYKIDPNESWKYSCTSILPRTTTNTVTATGISDDLYRQTATAKAVTTVQVGETSSTNSTPVATVYPVTKATTTVANITKTPSTKATTTKQVLGVKIAPKFPASGFPPENSNPSGFPSENSSLFWISSALLIGGLVMVEQISRHSRQ